MASIPPSERELRTRIRQQEVVTRLGQQALEEADLDKLMHDAAEAVAATLDNEYAKVLELMPDGEHVFLRQGVGWRDGLVGAAHVPTDLDSQAGYTLLSEKPVIVEDLTTEERFSGPELLTSHGVISGISVIIGTVAEPWGVLGTHDTERREFTEHDVNFVQSVANLLAAAIERHEYQHRLEEMVATLEESNQRLEQFAYAASHDLQEPLRMVSTYLQLIEDRHQDDLPDEVLEYLEYAIDGADRMREMTKALLAYSQIEEAYDPAPTDLNVVFQTVFDDLEGMITETGATVTADDLPAVMGDSSQLHQLLRNLVNNAIKYHEETTPRVHVSAERTDGVWVISVEDNGIGIDPDEHSRIFEVFYRLHSDTEYAGTGIGLALCERIIERHGGKIWVESDPGEGATFTFTLRGITKTTPA